MVPKDKNIGESPEELESNKLRHWCVYLTFSVYKFGWQSPERGFDQFIGQLDLNALLVSGQSVNTEEQPVPSKLLNEFMCSNGINTYSQYRLQVLFLLHLFKFSTFNLLLRITALFS